MLVKFFTPTQSKGALGGLDYLLDENRNTKPELLYGNPDITKGLLLNSTFKNPYTTGCLSFAEEESQIDKHLQDELMQSFEETLLAGLDGNQYDIIWIRHDDKGRLELNFHILNTELQTGKRLQPYLHQFDKPRIEAWKSLQNDLHNLADPNAPERKRMLVPGALKQEWQSVKNAVHNYLEDAWINNEINNRNDLLNEISNLGGEIKRQGRDYISVKFPDVKKNIRLKGELYNDNLKPCEKSTAEKEKIQKIYDSERESRIERNRETVDNLNKKLGEHRDRKYKRVVRAQEETKELFKAVNDDIAAYNDSVNNSNRNLRENISELRKRVSRMQELSSNERQKAILQTIKPNNKNKNERYQQRGKNIRNRLRSLRASNLRNGIVKKRDDIDREKLQRFAEEIIKELLRSSRERKIRHAHVQRYGSHRDASKTNNKPLHDMRERKANSRDRRSDELDF